MPRRNRWAVWLVGAVVLGLVAVTVVLVRTQVAPEPTTVVVMTRNLYLGGDINRPVRAAQGRTGRDAVVALGRANHELRQIVDRTDFAVRSRRLAGEIARTQPDLVGLQEVALWRSGPLELDRLGQPNATVVDQDFLALLLAALRETGAEYEVVQAQRESDVEAPAFTGDPLTGAATSARDVRLTLSDVILRRRSSAATVTASGGGQYTPRLETSLGGAPFAFTRGFAWADVTSGAVRFRFVTTHLESQSADVAVAQARELVTGAGASSDRPTIVVGDANSDPDDATIRPGQTVAQSGAYDLLTGTGFVDTWLDPAAGTSPGDTAALSELVDDSIPAFDRRLDLVLVRDTEATRARIRGRERTGAEVGDRDPATGLWPSDHAGVVVAIQLG